MAKKNAALRRPVAGLTFAEAVRRRIVEEAGPDGKFRAADVTYFDEGKKVAHFLQDAIKRNEVERVSRGLYRYLGRDKNSRGAANVRKAIWRTLRAKMTVSLFDLVELAHANKDYAREVMAEFVEAGAARLLRNGKWRLAVCAPVEMPPAKETAARPRGLSERQKLLLSKLDALDSASAAVRQQVELLGEPIED